MARGIPTYDGDGSSCDGDAGGGGSGRQYITQSSSLSSSSSYPHVDSFYYSSLDRGSIGDFFFGNYDIRDTRDLAYKEDVLDEVLEAAIKEGLLLHLRAFRVLEIFCAPSADVYSKRSFDHFSLIDFSGHCPLSQRLKRKLQLHAQY